MFQTLLAARQLNSIHTASLASTELISIHHLFKLNPDSLIAYSKLTRHVQLECLGLHKHSHCLHSRSILGHITLQPVDLAQVDLQLLPLLTTVAVPAWECAVGPAQTCQRMPTHQPCLSPGAMLFTLLVWLACIALHCIAYLRERQLFAGHFAGLQHGIFPMLCVEKIELHCIEMALLVLR